LRTRDLGEPSRAIGIIERSDHDVRLEQVVGDRMRARTCTEDTGYTLTHV
jgi:hypothetical protein